MVDLMNRFGWYGYGMEKSFTHRSLRQLVRSCGFKVVGRGGILFMPGWLRMADLLFHTRYPRLTSLTDWITRPFAWLYRNVPAVRSHGYLIVCVVVKPPHCGRTGESNRQF